MSGITMWHWTYFYIAATEDAFHATFNLASWKRRWYFCVLPCLVVAGDVMWSYTARRIFRLPSANVTVFPIAGFEGIDGGRMPRAGDRPV